MSAYYNEFDPKAAAWLRELIKRDLIADGEVDKRSILDVQPDDLRGYTQCHFFAGIGGWSYALRLAGWPDDRPVWTGSPPCQPFSSAGAQLGADDERHLAPHWLDRLVAECRPERIFGEQVASAAIFGKVAKRARSGTAVEVAGDEWCWLDDLSGRLERACYAVGASDLPSASVGAPHIRQRTFFGAVGLDDTAPSRRREERQIGTGQRTGNGTQGRAAGYDAGGDTGGLADADSARPQGHGGFIEQHDAQRRKVSTGRSTESGEHSRLEHAPSGCSDGGEHRLLAQDGSGSRSGHQGSRDDADGLGNADSGRTRTRSGNNSEEAFRNMRSENSPSIPLRAGDNVGLGDADSGKRDGVAEFCGSQRDRQDARRSQSECESQPCVDDGWLEHDYCITCGRHRDDCGCVLPDLASTYADEPYVTYDRAPSLDTVRTCSPHEPWRDADWLYCRDGKWRPVGPGTFPLAHGVFARVVRLRGYGNAIVPQAAAEFIRSFERALDDLQH